MDIETKKETGINILIFIILIIFHYYREAMKACILIVLLVFIAVANAAGDHLIHLDKISGRIPGIAARLMDRDDSVAGGAAGELANLKDGFYGLVNHLRERERERSQTD